MNKTNSECGECRFDGPWCDISKEIYREYSYFAKVDGEITEVVSEVFFPKALKVVNGVQYVRDHLGLVHCNPDVGVRGCQVVIWGKW